MTTLRILSASLGLRAFRAQAFEKSACNVADGFVVPRGVIGVIPEMRQTLIQLRQQIRMALREKPDGAEKEVLDRHLSVSCCHSGCYIRLILQVTHGTPPAVLGRRVLSTPSLYAAVRQLGRKRSSCGAPSA